MRLALSLPLLLIVSLSGRADDWTTLFNGKDLTGWRANNDPESFTVNEGVLRVQSTGKSAAHLFFVGDRKEGFETFKNFELELSAKAEKEANSGIFIHTDMSVANAAKHLAKGYEIQLNSTSKEKRKTGSLYAIKDLAESPVDETNWFTIRILVNGKRITVAINGKETVDYTEPDDVVRPKERAGRLLMKDGGGIAIQAHDPKSIWYFKDVRVKRLP